MRTETGELKQVDRGRARRQWEHLRTRLSATGLALDVVHGPADCPDFVFCANQALPIPAGVTGGAAHVLPSRMASAERQPEVETIVRALERQGYTRTTLAQAGTLEGTGDGLWHPGRRLLWAGVGPRSSAAVWRALATKYALEIVSLRLVDPDFYHLDTCLAWLDETTCLYVPEAFDERGRALIEAVAGRALAVPADEARRLLACNAFCPDGSSVFVQTGCRGTNDLLTRAGYRPIEVETDEFLKAGGSVFCMKLFHGPLTTDRATRLA